MLRKHIAAPLVGMAILFVVPHAGSQDTSPAPRLRMTELDRSDLERGVPLKEWRRQRNPATLNSKVVDGEAGRILGDIGEAWVRNYPSPNIGTTVFRATAVKTDAQQNVYITGYGGVQPNYDYITIMYNAAGAMQWSAFYNGPANGDDKAVDIAVDGTGNVYVTGLSTGSGSGYDYATVKYSPGGTQLWASRYNGPGNGTDQATAIALDGSGNVHVTGFSVGSGSPSPAEDFATVKYNSATGGQLWVARYNASNEGDFATAIAVDGSGNVYVTGLQSNSALRIATAKYNSNGALQWLTTYGVAAHDASANDIAIDASGNVYVTGVLEDRTSFVGDVATVKYNTSGTQQWAVLHNVPFSTYNEADAVAVDGSGNVFVTGYTQTNADFDYLTIKYTSTSSLLWLQQYGNPAGNDDRAFDLVLDNNGDVYVTGRSWTGLNYDFVTIKYTSGGTQDWLATYSNPNNASDEGAALAVDTSRNVYVAGKSYNVFGDIMTTVKYTEAINARVKVFLMGPYNSVTNLMNNGLRTSGTLASRFPGIPIPGQAVDSITIEIRSDIGPTSPSVVRFFAAAWLMTDGTIRSFADTTKDYVSFGAPSANYYLVVWHRNHLAVMSSTNPLIQITPVTTWDFSTGLSQAYLSGHIQIDTSPVRYGTRGGDGNGDGGIDALDRNNVWRPANGSAGYLPADFNLDGGVDAIDRNTVWRPNNGFGTTVP